MELLRIEVVRFITPEWKIHPRSPSRHHHTPPILTQNISECKSAIHPTTAPNQSPSLPTVTPPLVCLLEL